VQRHIPSQFSKEMNRSHWLNNENKLNEMKHILAHYMKYVPTLPAEGTLICRNGREVIYDDTQFDRKLIGGDQLTVARIRGTQCLRASEDKRVNRYEGLAPVVEDWHARMTLLKVIKLYISPQMMKV